MQQLTVRLLQDNNNMQKHTMLHAEAQRLHPIRIYLLTNDRLFSHRQTCFWTSVIQDFIVMKELSFNVCEILTKKNKTPENNNARQKTKAEKCKLVSKEEEQRQEAHSKTGSPQSKQTIRENGLKVRWRSSPLDALEGAARHVHDAACGTSDHAHQTFPDALKEASGPLPFRPCRHQHHICHWPQIRW